MSTDEKADAAPQEPPLPPHLRREYRTIRSMMFIWCQDRHGRDVRRQGLCAECGDLLTYAGQRLLKCPYGEDKPACTKCPVHCYKRTQREQVRAVMRYAGPRMLWRHPLQALLHVVDKLRNVEHPLTMRRKRTPPPP